MEVSVLSHVTNSIIVVQALQWLKTTTGYQRFAAAMPIADAKVHVLMSAAGAFGAAIGMHGAVAGSSEAGWQMTLSVPPLWLLLHSIWDWAQQFALNQGVFAITVQQKAAAPVVTARMSPDVSVTAPIGEHTP